MAGYQALVVAHLPAGGVDRFLRDIDPGTVDDVMVGCVGGAGEQSATPGRQA